MSNFILAGARYAQKVKLDFVRCMFKGVDLDEADQLIDYQNDSENGNAEFELSAITGSDPELILKELEARFPAPCPGIATYVVQGTNMVRKGSEFVTAPVWLVLRHPLVKFLPNTVSLNDLRQLCWNRIIFFPTDIKSWFVNIIETDPEPANWTYSSIQDASIFYARYLPNATKLCAYKNAVKLFKFRTSSYSEEYVFNLFDSLTEIPDGLCRFYGEVYRRIDLYVYRSYGHYRAILVTPNQVLLARDFALKMTRKPFWRNIARFRNDLNRLILQVHHNIKKNYYPEFGRWLLSEARKIGLKVPRPPKMPRKPKTVKRKTRNTVPKTLTRIMNKM